MGTFGGDAKERDGIDPVAAERAFRTGNAPIGAQRDLSEQVRGMVQVFPRLALGGRGESCRDLIDKGRVVARVIRVQERGNADVVQDARGRVDQVEIRQTAVCALCPERETTLSAGRGGGAF